MRRSFLLSAVLPLLACSSRSAPDPVATSPLAVVRSHVELSSRIVNAKLRAVDDGFVADAAAMRGALRAVLPSRSNDAIRITHDKGRLAILPLGLADVAGVNDGAARVFTGVAPSTDLVVTAAVEGVEELRVLHSPKAPTTFRWSVDGGTARVTDRGVELVDGDGVVRASAPRPFALDARGARRDLSVRIDRGVLVAELDTRDLAFPIVVDPSWTAAGTIRSVSGLAMAFTLPDGNAVVFPRDAAPWVDLYNPTTRAWSSSADVPVPWSAPSGSYPGTAAQLTNGDVIYLSYGNAFARYNATAKTWTTYSATQVYNCNGCVLTRLNDGRLLKYPGYSSGAEIFNPTTNTWSSIAAPPQAPAFGAVTLNDGRVLALEANVGQTLYIYNPSSNSWASGPTSGRYAGARLTKLKDGRILIVGFPSGSGAPPPVGRVVNAAATTVTQTYPFIRNRANPAVVLLPSGRVMVAGGSDFGVTNVYNDAELYDPVYNSFNLIDPFATTGRYNSGITLIGNGSALMVGGNSTTGIKNDAFRYDPIADGGSCAAPAYAVTCNAAYCVDGVCCNSASCPGGTCAAPAAPGRPAGTCAKNLGQACTANAQCASNFCVDGVCCNSACNGQCQACNLSPTPGSCRAVTGAPIGGRPACSGAGAGTVCGASCNGTDGSKCNYGPAGVTACGKDSCTAGVETVSGTCNGAGSCSTTTNACGAYACGADACKRSCAVEADCAAGNYCLGDKCVPKVGLGSACTSTAMCPSGLFCTDGVCCGVKSCGAGSSCAAGDTKGECKKLLATECTADGECGSGFCVDGVCCNRKCEGQCEACDVPATKGTCSPVNGVPRGSRAPCDDGGELCKARSCDGATDTTKCVGYKNGGTVTCKAASCDGSSLVPVSSCDGAGSCVTPPVAKCGKYACNPAGASGPECRDDCGKNSDCAEGFFCVGGTCSEGARCSEDRTASISTDGITAPCAPYVCGTDGTCMRNCAITADCAAGAVCELQGGIGTCKVPEPPAEDGGGCALGPHPSRGLAAFALFALGLAAVARRRRA